MSAARGASSTLPTKAGTLANLTTRNSKLRGVGLVSFRRGAVRAALRIAPTPAARGWVSRPANGFRGALVVHGSALAPRERDKTRTLYAGPSAKRGALEPHRRQT